MTAWSRVGDGLLASAGWIFAAYLLVPSLFKAAIQPLFPVDLTAALAVPATAVGLLWLARARRALPWPSAAGLALWGLLTGLVLIGVVNSPSLPIAIRSGASWLLLAALPLLAAFAVAAHPKQLRQFLFAFGGAGTLFAFLGMVMLPFVGAGELEVLETNRLAVARGVLMVPLIAVPLFVWRDARALGVFGLALTPFCVLVAVATGSRGPVIAFVAVATAATVGGLLSSRHRARTGLVAAVSGAGTLVILIALASLLPAHSIARFGLLSEAVVPDASQPQEAGTTQSAPDDPGQGPLATTPPTEAGLSKEPVGGRSVAARLELAELALATFRDSSLVGSGTGGYEAAAARRPETSLFSHPHNVVLHIMADFGLLGLFVLSAMGAMTLASWRPVSAAAVAVGLVFSFLFLNALVSNGLYENRMLWGVWLILLGMPTLRFARA